MNIPLCKRLRIVGCNRGSGRDQVQVAGHEFGFFVIDADNGFAFYGTVEAPIGINQPLEVPVFQVDLSSGVDFKGHTWKHDLALSLHIVR